MTSAELIELFNKNKKTLPYAKELKEGVYYGWTKDFNIRAKANPKEVIWLDLHKEADMFLLFVLASAWSRSGKWENPALFVSYLKGIKKLDTMEKIKKFIVSFPKGRKALTKFSEDIYNDAIKSLTFIGGTWGSTGHIRYDIYYSIRKLYRNWDAIKNSLNRAQEDGDYRQFMLDLRSIKGLSYGIKKMKIKIPLVLRELRIQEIYKGIPGEYCCVPDSRVKKAIKCISDLTIEFDFDRGNDEFIVGRLIDVSTKIYKEFGDWYDIVLFAYADLTK